MFTCINDINLFTCTYTIKKHAIHYNSDFTVYILQRMTPVKHFCIPTCYCPIRIVLNNPKNLNYIIIFCIFQSSQPLSTAFTT